MQFKKIFIIVAFIFIGCQEEQNCDLGYYPNAPYGYPDDTYYSDTMVRYLYVCWNDSGYNKIYTYRVVGECWELVIDTESNFNCT